MRHAARTTLALLLGCLLAPPGLAQDDTAPMPGEIVEQGVREGEAPKADFQNAEQLLDALENADKDIDRLSAGIRYTKVFAIAGDTQQREGVLRFQLRPRKMFEIEFKTLRIGDEVHDVRQAFVFDGEWFTEVYPDEKPKLMIHRRVVAPGQSLDPFDLEQGPFPLPIGQRKDVILERFEARLAEPQEGLINDEPFAPLAARANAGHWVQLVLTPREGVNIPNEEGRAFETLRMWYDPVTLLPVMGLSVEPIEGALADKKLLEFFKVRTNEEAEEGRFSLERPPPEEGWDEIWRDDTGMGG
ncbi:MAG: hypothetical protein R3B57_03155 [Phycisphaerales bacterium]